jgi:oligoribonuclease
VTADRRHSFLWLDLETTGLDPATGRILEWAVVLAADDAEGDMMPVEEYSSVVAVPRAVALGLCDDFVKRMHTANGLFDACNAATDDPGADLATAEAFIVDLIGGEATRGVILAGSTVHFDLAWIRVHMPTLARCLSHRCFDVSTLKMAERGWFDATFHVTEDRTVHHRALPDVLASLVAAKAWREVVAARSGCDCDHRPQCSKYESGGA